LEDLKGGGIDDGLVGFEVGKSVEVDGGDIQEHVLVEPLVFFLIYSATTGLIT
jgi:hypothetical protein